MLRFGAFDHLDHNGASLGDQLEDRLKLIGVLETEGYYAHHVAEHHSTRLGMAPSPSVFLAAVTQRTRSIKFGPLVYVLPLHHPLRLYEEICMLDHLSGGRLQLGIGRGGALLEHQRYGIDPATAQAMYHDAFAVLMQAREVEGDLPMIGISRHIVVAETDGEGRRIANEAYRPWREALDFVFQKSGVAFPLAAAYPQRFDELAAIGHGIAGSPATVLNFLKELTRETGVNYVACNTVFGTMRFEAAATSVRLLAREVIPKLQRHPDSPEIGRRSFLT